jgi:hypothetical protein
MLSKERVTGKRGYAGWIMTPSEIEAYREHYAAHHSWLQVLWFFFIPQTSLRIAYANAHGGVSIVNPDPYFMAMLKRGGVIRDMRVIDHFGSRGNPVFEGSGEFLPPMTERQAVDYIGWRDIPRAVNHRVVLHASDIPQDRSRRNEWVLGERGIELPAQAPVR